MTPKETKRISIEGGLVRVERVAVEREARTEDFVAEIARMQPLDSGLLPEGCAFVRRWCDEGKATQSLYLVERAPCMQAVRFRPMKGAEEEQALLLSWPRTLWCCRTFQAPAADFASIGECSVAVIERPLREEGLATRLLRLPMPNLYEDGNGPVCTGNLHLAEARAEQALRIGDLIRQVLDSHWNDDLMPNFEGLGIDGLEDWGAKSAADPELYTKISYRSHAAATVGGLLEDLTRRP